MWQTAIDIHRPTMWIHLDGWNPLKTGDELGCQRWHQFPHEIPTMAPLGSPPWGSPRHISAPAHLSTVCEAAVASVGKKTSEAQPMAVQNPGMFPKMVVAQNHPNLDHFSTETHGLGDPPF